MHTVRRSSLEMWSPSARRAQRPRDARAAAIRQTTRRRRGKRAARGGEHGCG